MQPLKLIITGNYWDSQIYAGRLYLFGQSGDILTIDWDRLISEWTIEEDVKIALFCAFQRSDYLYYEDMQRLFQDNEIKNIFKQKFARLLLSELHVSQSQIHSTTINIQDNPMPFPHTDSQIYKYDLYTSSQSGVYRATCKGKTKYPISTRPEKKWDAYVLALSANYGSLALAAGDDGLFELPIQTSYRSIEPHQLNKDNCINCNWAFYSIYGSSHIGSGYLADFNKEKQSQEFQDYDNIYNRRFNKLITESTIFQSRGYSWGVQDKLCQAHGNRIHIVKYTPWEKDDQKRLQDLGSVDFAPWKGDIVSGGLATFGIIIECMNALVIIPSEGQIITLEGEPINWRVFPRSKHYENQLHIIYDDRIEILSFNHDYFVDQTSKLSGIKPITYGKRRSSS